MYVQSLSLYLNVLKTVCIYDYVLKTVDFVFDTLRAVCRVCALRVGSPIRSHYTKADAFVVGLLEWGLLAV